MTQAPNHIRWRSALTAVTALGTILALSPAYAQEADDAVAQSRSTGIEVMTVTAQKQEENLLDVPISVTAFDSGALDARQIDAFSDLQFATPNVTFTKGNFTGSNLQIRGIGVTAVGTSGDTGVGIHQNDVYLNAPRLFEIEYFDIERVEVLRGPQGTLYGRNATAGTVNVITAKPLLDEFTAFVEAQYGNFDHRRIKGHVNTPIIEDVLGVRVAGIWLERDGYTENIFNGEDIDGRDQYAIRGSLRFTPTDRTTFDVTVDYQTEDSNRSRAVKQLCNRDESAILGCLPDKLAFETTNGDATLAGLLTTDLVLGPLGLSQFGAGSNSTSINPKDLRQTNLDFIPEYEVDNWVVTAQVQHELTDELTLTVLGGYSEGDLVSRADYNNTVNDPATLPAAFPFALPNTFAALYADGLFPISKITGGNSGVIGLNIDNRSPFLDGYDQSATSHTQYSVEARINTDFDGPLNFMLAGYYLDFEADSDYYVVSSGLDYFAAVGAGADGVGLVAPYFNSETDLYTLESYAAFGEAYYQPVEDVKFTLGLRYTVDDKFVRDRQLLFNTAALIGTSNVNPILATQVDGDPGTPGQQEYREDDVTFREVTGRFVVDWTPEVAFTDDTLVYASYSRGYKGGGLNPPFDPTLFPNTEPAFEPEFINAIEIGTKNTLFDGRLQASLAGFYYDYSGLQVSKIVNRTSINENIDATIWGLEGEFMAAPVDNWLLNLSFSYLNSEIGDAESVDGRDPTNGSADVTLIKDLATTSNCIVEHNGLPDPVTAGLLPTFTALGLPYIPAQTEGIANAAFSSCDGLAATFAGAGLPYTVSDGVPADLEGNQLQNSPEWTVSLGAQYTHEFEVGDTPLSVVPRVDYYWQGDMFARIFNRSIDRIESWDQLNASITLNGPEERWYVRGFVQNLLDSDQITGHYFTDPSSGNFTNVFVLEPRLYGVTVGVNF